MAEWSRDAQPWRRAGEEISWGNKNRKGGGSDQESLRTSYASISPKKGNNPDNSRGRSAVERIEAAGGWKVKALQIKPSRKKDVASVTGQRS